MPVSKSCPVPPEREAGIDCRNRGRVRFSDARRKPALARMVALFPFPFLCLIGPLAGEPEDEDEPSLFVCHALEQRLGRDQNRE